MSGVTPVDFRGVIRVGGYASVSPTDVQKFSPVTLDQLVFLMDCGMDFTVTDSTGATWTNSLVTADGETKYSYVFVNNKQQITFSQALAMVPANKTEGLQKAIGALYTYATEAQFWPMTEVDDSAASSLETKSNQSFAKNPLNFEINLAELATQGATISTASADEGKKIVTSVAQKTYVFSHAMILSKEQVDAVLARVLALGKYGDACAQKAAELQPAFSGSVTAAQKGLYIEALQDLYEAEDLFKQLCADVQTAEKAKAQSMDENTTELIAECNGGKLMVADLNAICDGVAPDPRTDNCLFAADNKACNCTFAEAKEIVEHKPSAMVAVGTAYLWAIRSDDLKQMPATTLAQLCIAAALDAMQKSPADFQKILDGVTNVAEARVAKYTVIGITGEKKGEYLGLFVKNGSQWQLLNPPLEYKEKGFTVSMDAAGNLAVEPNPTFLNRNCIVDNRGAIKPQAAPVVADALGASGPGGAGGSSPNDNVVWVNFISPHGVINNKKLTQEQLQVLTNTGKLDIGGDGTVDVDFTDGKMSIAEWKALGLGTDAAFLLWAQRGSASALNADGTVKGKTEEEFLEIAELREMNKETIVYLANALGKTAAEVESEYLVATSFKVVDKEEACRRLIGAGADFSADTLYKNLNPIAQKYARVVLNRILRASAGDGATAPADNAEIVPDTKLSADQLEQFFAAMAFLMQIDDAQGLLGAEEGLIGKDDKLQKLTSNKVSDLMKALFTQKYLAANEGLVKDKAGEKEKVEGEEDGTEGKSDVDLDAVTDFSGCDSEEDVLQEFQKRASDMEKKAETEFKGPAPKAAKAMTTAKMCEAAAARMTSEGRKDMKFQILVMAYDNYVEAFDAAKGILGNPDTFKPDKLTEARQIFDEASNAWKGIKIIIEALSNTQVTLGKVRDKAIQLAQIGQQFSAETTKQNDGIYDSTDAGFKKAEIDPLSVSAQLAGIEAQKNAKPGENAERLAKFAQLETMVDGVQGKDSAIISATALPESMRDVAHLLLDSIVQQSRDGKSSIPVEEALKIVRLLDKVYLLSYINNGEGNETWSVSEQGKMVVFCGEQMQTYMDGLGKLPNLKGDSVAQKSLCMVYDILLYLQEQVSKPWVGQYEQILSDNIKRGLLGGDEARNNEQIKKLKHRRFKGLSRELSDLYKDKLGGKVDKSGKPIPPEGAPVSTSAPASAPAESAPAPAGAAPVDVQADASAGQSAGAGRYDE
ncbi:MAG: hypothetical protein WC901_04235 [Candidatus Margulisiibacteriota bacterium]